MDATANCNSARNKNYYILFRVCAMEFAVVKDIYFSRTIQANLHLYEVRIYQRYRPKSHL